VIDSFWKKATEFHGHACPGLAIGVRAREFVVNNPEFAKLPYGVLHCVTENDACGVDAIQCILGCSFGKGNLSIRRTAKHAYSFFDTANNHAVRICLKLRKKPDISREDWQQSLLSAPLDDVFTVSTPSYSPPDKPKIFSNIYCDRCGEGVAEHCIRLSEGQRLCLDCWESYGRGW